jgi:hypothetical protein
MAAPAGGTPNVLNIPNTAGGGIQITGVVNNISDASLKENVEPIPNSLEKVCRLNGVYYNLIANPSLGRQIGLIAQEVKEVIPEVVAEHVGNGKLGISYAQLTAVLINAIKELEARVAALEAK